MGESNIFKAEPGGLRTSGEIKIFVCFLLDNATSPLSMKQITDLTQICRAANYFEVGQAVSDLLKTDAIIEVEVDGTTAYALTEEGKSCVKTLATDIPLSLRDKAIFAISKLMDRVRAEKENNVTIQQALGGYQITCEVADRSLELLTVKMLASDFGSASDIKERFLNDPSGIYRSIVNVMTGNKA